MDASSSANTPNGGRDVRGRFAKGNPGGPGNPHAKKVAQLRSALLRAVSMSDLRAVVKKLVDLALAGDVPAARLIMDRLLGPSVPLDIETRLAELEQRASQQQRK